MKGIILSLLATFLMWQGVFAQTPKGYTISGTAEGCVDGDTVYLCSMSGYFQLIPEDTTVIKDGKYAFKGEFEGADIRFLCAMHGDTNIGMSMIVLENADFQANIHADGSKKDVKGGPSTPLYKEYEDGVEAAFGEGSGDLFRISTDSTKTEAERADAKAKLQVADARVADYRYNFIMKHLDSPVSGMLLAYVKYDLDSVRFEQILTAMDAASCTYPQFKAEMAERAAAKATAIGAQYTDLSLNDPDGNPIRVSDYVTKNRYTMIDFWASWCGPCIKEMPWVVKAYEAYHSKGFEVVGISLDNKKDAWLKAIARLNMPWPHMSDLKGWECQAAQPYNIKEIPANVLIDQSGTIVAKNLRGQDLLDKLAELLK